MEMQEHIPDKMSGQNVKKNKDDLSRYMLNICWLRNGVQHDLEHAIKRPTNGLTEPIHLLFTHFHDSRENPTGNVIDLLEIDTANLIKSSFG